MTKSEFIDLVVEKTGNSREEATKAVETLLESLGEADAEEISFAGLGNSSARPAEELREEIVALEEKQQEINASLEQHKARLEQIAAS